VCHALLLDRSFFSLLIQIDDDLAATTRQQACPCGGALHQADYPRKPRGCPRFFREAFSWRRSFCCQRCRGRSTPPSVRFLGRRVYLGLIVVLASVRGRGHDAQAAELAKLLQIPVRTLRRWQQWWQQELAATPFWQQVQGDLMPPVDMRSAPASLLARFAGPVASALRALLGFLQPLTTRVINLAKVS